MEKLLQIGEEFEVEGEKLLEFVDNWRRKEKKNVDNWKRKKKDNVDNWKRKRKESVNC